MAGIASDAGMLPIQRKPGRGPMIELRGIEQYNFKVFAVVIAMAISAPFVGYMCMNSARGVHSDLDFLVAIETLVVRESPPIRMARGAFVDPFQRMMRVGESAGRDLRVSRKGNEGNKYQCNAACEHSTTPHIAKQDGRDNVDQENDEQDYGKRNMNDMPVLKDAAQLFKKKYSSVQDGPSSGDSRRSCDMIWRDAVGGKPC